MKYFKLEEFNCPCCGFNNMKDVTLKSLDIAREKTGIPFKINSATRCPKHNKEVEGEENSAHLSGWASDISAKTDNHKYKIVKALLDVGCNRIGIYKTFIHCDFDPTKPKNVIWNG